MSSYQDALNEHNPSNWSIISNDGTNLVAHNNKTNRDFSGTTVEFNKYTTLTVKPPRNSHYDIVSGVETGRQVLDTPIVMYVRHDGRNGNGLENTPESAFSNLPSLLEYIDLTYDIRDPYGWFNKPIIKIMMVGTWNLGFVYLILPRANKKYYSMEIVFEDKATNFIDPQIISDPTVYFGMRGVNVKGMSVDYNAIVHVSDCIIAGTVYVYRGAYFSPGNCEIKDGFALNIWEAGTIKSYDYITGSSNITLDMTSNLSNIFVTAKRFALVDLDGITINTNGFSNSAARFDVSFSSQINRTGDSTKSFLPGTAGIEHSNGIYTF